MNFRKLLSLSLFCIASVSQLVVKLFSDFSRTKWEAVFVGVLSRLVSFTLVVLIGFNLSTGSAFAVVCIKDAMPKPTHEFREGDKVQLVAPVGPLNITVGTGTITSLKDNSVAASGKYDVLSNSGDWSFTISSEEEGATYQVEVKLTGDVNKEVNFSGSASEAGDPNDCSDGKTTITYSGNGQTLTQSCQEYKKGGWLGWGSQTEAVFIEPSFEIKPLGKVKFKVSPLNR